MNTTNRSKSGGCLRNILGIIAFFALGVAFLIGFDLLVAPWAWGEFGRPTLTGEWVGTFKLPAGQRGAAYLNLTHNSNEDFHPGRLRPDLTQLGGTAQGCFSASGIQAYALGGGATANGNDVELSFNAQKPTVPNYALQELKGGWDGNTLTLSGTFVTILDAQGSTMHNSEPNQTQPTTIVLHKGNQTDFQKACQTLAQ